MLHAVIESRHCALHLISEVNAYNMQTLRQHVTGPANEHEPVYLKIQLDPADIPEFERHTRRWLPVMVSTGRVEVQLVQPTDTVPRATLLRPEQSAA